MSGSQNKMMSSMATPTRRRRGLASKLGPSGMSGFGDIGVATTTTTTSSIGPSGSFDNNNNNENPIPAQVSPLGGSERSSVGAAIGATSIASATNTSTVSTSKVGVSLKPPRRVISLSPPLTRRGTVSNSKASTAPTAPPFNEHDNATTNSRPSSKSTDGTFERKAPRREKSHDIDDEYFMGIPKNSNRRRYFHARPVDPNVSGGADMNGSSSAQSNWFSSYYASKMMNHKLSLIIIQIIGLFLIVVMGLGVIVILQQGFSVVEGGFPAGAGTGGGPSPSSPYHQAIDAMNNPPRSAQVTPELLEKLHQDNQLQHEELENLKKELRELHEKQEQQQQQKQTSGNGMKEVLQRSAGDAAGGPPVAAAAASGAAGGGGGRARSRSPVDEAFDKMKQRSEQERQKKLRGAAAAAAASSLADQLPPAEKDVHLINRSPWEIQVFWISQNVIGYDPDDGTPMVEWLLMSGEEDRNILPSTTYHFHARPSHKFGIKRYPSNDSVIYVAPEFPQDQYVVLTEDFTIDMISDHTNSPFHAE